MWMELGEHGCFLSPAPRRRQRVARFMVAAVLNVLLLLQAGCSASFGRHPYPSEWPSFKTVPVNDGCPDLAGTYGNTAMAAFPPTDGAPPSLGAVFTEMAHGRSPTSPGAWNQSWPEIPLDASSVSIDQTSETLTVTFIDASGNRTSLPFRRYRFRLSEKRVDDLFGCRNLYGEPMLLFFADPEGWSSVSLVYAAARGVLVALLKADDGSLVVNQRSNSMGLSLLLVGTHYSADNLWYRYPLLAPPGDEQH